ncbi:helix-turn-helix transcriptional regulator [Streptomyces niveus]|uniref:helix-turn-helix domain-containing protein n=1 Tax=Streptomyces niveus TaxID=193462 RepID=UPI0036C4B72C
MPGKILSNAERTQLTPTETGVLTLAAAGLSNQGIATRLGIQPGTVSQHLTNIGAKFDTRDRTAHVRAALSTGRITPPVLPGDMPHFTSTELKLLRTHAQHSRPDAAAKATGLPQQAVKTNIANLVKKARARDRAHLIGLVYAWGLPDVPFTGGRRALLTALLAESTLGISVLATGPGAEIMIRNRPQAWAGWTAGTPAASSPVARLTEVLRRYEIPARVEPINPALSGPGFLRISLEPADDLNELIAGITDDLITESVRLLTAAFGAALVTPGRVRASESRGFSILDLDLPDALHLYDLLTDDPDGRFDESTMGCDEVKDLAVRLGQLLSTASGGVVSTEADPACSTCTISRRHRIEVGSVRPAQARRLADAIHQALAPPS